MKRLLLAASIAALAVISAPPASASAEPSASPPAPAADTRPNILIWMLDDVGFAQLSAFGGLIPTPNIDRVAAQGLRYSNYNTAPICSASRAALLTGRNPHTVHSGGHAVGPRPYPGYDALIPASAGTIAANFRAAGYVTYAVGKWDHLPSSEMTPAGPFDRWPTRQGFDRFYGFLAADTDGWSPQLMKDSFPAPLSGKSGYHLNADLADTAISMIASRTARSPLPPFLLYFATSTAHAPHHAPREWLDRFKGRFDSGWDVARDMILQRQIAEGLLPAGTRLGPRPDGMAAWADLNADQKRLYARQMEAFAASLAYADFEFGRILDMLEASGQLDNTIIVIASDNGASAEGAYDGTHNEALFINNRSATLADNLKFIDQWGGPETYPLYAFGWAVAGNTPFRYYKQTAYQGGTRVPFILSWPQGIPARGEVRGQFVHVSDVTPTLMELAGVPMARIVNNVEQSPFDGLSFTYSIRAAAAADRKKAQYFEMYGNKALWSQGWSIVTNHREKTWDVLMSTPPNEPWELYDLSRDPGQTTNLADTYPEKVKSLARLFDQQARQFNVYPIGNMAEAFPYIQQAAQAEFARRQGRWTFTRPVSYVAERTSPPIISRAYRMTAKVGLATGRENGPIFAIGGSHGGIALYLKDGVPAFILRDLAGRAEIVRATRPLPAGVSELELTVDRSPKPPMTLQQVRVTIAANGESLAARSVDFAMPGTFGVDQTFDIGVDWGSTVSSDYAAGVPFAGTLDDIVFDFNRDSPATDQ